MTFTNNSGLPFNDISSEAWREYVFPDGAVVRIDNPTHLNVSRSSGGHRLFDGNGISHYIPAGWVHLRWQAKSGAAHYSF